MTSNCIFDIINVQILSSFNYFDEIESAKIALKYLVRGGHPNLDNECLQDQILSTSAILEGTF